MKKTNVRIKDITLADQINAIERIVSSYFVDGDYTPYFVNEALIIAIVDNFIEGVEFGEDDNLLEIAQTDEDIKPLVQKFLDVPKKRKKKSEDEVDYYGITTYIMDCVRDKVEFMKQHTIHNTGDMKKITEFCDVMIDAFSNFANLVTNKMTPEQMEEATKLMTKLAESNLTKEDFSSILKESVGFDMDKASEEVIDSKNKQLRKKDERIVELVKQNTELRKYKEQNEVRNVVADK